MGLAANTTEEEIIDLGKTDAKPVTARVDEMTVRVKKITTTDEGKLSIALESEGMTDEALENVKDMLVLQQNGVVKLTMLPVQRDMFDA